MFYAKKYYSFSIFLALVVSGNLAHAAQTEFTIGGEIYRETYREYENGNERFMQQRGNMRSIEGSAKFRFNDRHAAKLSGRYSRGKVEYTGGISGEEKGYGSIREGGLPRRSYDVRTVYEYTRPLNDRTELTLEAGLGYRELRDLSSRKNADDYDRKNATAYATVGAGLNILLPHSFEFSPKVAYNHMVYGRQYSYFGPVTIKNKQRSGKGVEVDLPVSYRFANRSKVSFGPFYRGWKVPDSNIVYQLDDEDPTLLHGFAEPKNYTHEAGVKLKYTF